MICSLLPHNKLPACSPKQHCHIVFHEEAGMMLDFIINERATPEICQNSYDKSVADCDVNYPAAVNPGGHQECRKRARSADKACRRAIPRH